MNLLRLGRPFKLALALPLLIGCGPKYIEIQPTVTGTPKAASMKERAVSTQIRDMASAFENNLNELVISELKREGWIYSKNGGDLILRISGSRGGKVTGITEESTITSRHYEYEEDDRITVNLAMTEMGKTIWDAEFRGDADELLEKDNLRLCIGSILANYRNYTKDDLVCSGK